MRKGSLLLLVFCLILPWHARGADWPQWGGLKRDGNSPEKGLLKTWPKAGPELVWTFEDAGTGYTAPAVVGGKVYLMGARKETEFLFALDAKGKELWATAIGPLYYWKGNQWSNGPNATPSVDGDTIVALGSQGVLLCTDLKGKEIWRKDLPKEMDAQVNDVQSPVKSPAWGYCWSPIIDGDQVIITPGGPNGLVAALDRKTGNVLWQSKEAKDAATYTSPMLAEIGGVKQVVTMVQDGAVGVSAKDGSLLWRYTREPYPDILASSPLIKGHQVYLTGWGGGATLLDITANGKKFKATAVYPLPGQFLKEISNKQGGVMLVDGFLYGFHEDRPWVCQEWATGAIKWESGRRGFGAGVPIYADGNLYCQGEDGTVGLIEASPKEYKLNGKFKLPKESTLRKSRGRIWTRPVLSDGLLYLRDQDLVFCYKIK
jgi:outer membrane protein assembly factor BamB